MGGNEEGEAGDGGEGPGLENDSDPGFDEEQADGEPLRSGARRQRRGRVYSHTIATKEQTTEFFIK